MLTTSIAGSLPRPAWLAEPETLKGAWKLSGQTRLGYGPNWP